LTASCCRRSSNSGRSRPVADRSIDRSNDRSPPGKLAR
jgi:hypothetical protein